MTLGDRTLSILHVPSTRNKGVRERQRSRVELRRQRGRGLPLSWLASFLVEMGFWKNWSGSFKG